MAHRFVCFLKNLSSRLAQLGQLKKLVSAQVCLTLICFLQINSFQNLAQAVTDWEILGVPKGASQAEIIKAWKVAAKGLHPDKNDDIAKAQKDFVAARAAYERLMALTPGTSGNSQAQQSRIDYGWRFYSVTPSSVIFNFYSSTQETFLTISQLERVIGSGDGVVFKRNMQDFINGHHLNLNSIMVWIPFFKNYLASDADKIVLHENMSNTLEAWIERMTFLQSDFQPVWESLLELQGFLLKYMQMVDSTVNASKPDADDELTGRYTQLSFDYLENLKSRFIMKVWQQEPSLASFFSNLKELASLSRRHDPHGILNLNTASGLDKIILQDVLKRVPISDQMNLIHSFAKLVQPYMSGIGDFSENYSIGENLVSRYMEMLSVNEQILIVGDTYLPKAFEWIGWTVSPKSYHRVHEKTMVDSLQAFSAIIKNKDFKNATDFVYLFRQLLMADLGGDQSDYTPRAYARAQVSAIAKHRDPNAEDLEVMRNEARKHFLTYIEKFQSLNPSDGEIRKLMKVLGWADDFGFFGIRKRSLNEAEVKEILSYASNRSHFDLLVKFFSIRLSLKDSIAIKFKTFKPQLTTVADSISQLQTSKFNPTNEASRSSIDSKNSCSILFLN